MSNVVNLPPNSHDGIYKGFLHKDGGIQSILENGKKLEIEKDEFHLCSAVLQSERVYEFKNATNKEILTKLFQDSNCVFVQGRSNFNDFIICRLVVLDDKKRNLTGTAKEIINILQSEKSCNVTEDAKEEFKKELGGSVSKKDFNKVTIKYKGFIPYVADSYSQKFNQKATLLRDYSDDTVVNENGKTDFKEPKYYSYGYLKAGTSLGTKRGWTLNLPKKGMSIEMQYHPQQFEEVKDLYWVFEGRVFPFPEDAKIEAKKITEKNQSFRDEYNLGNSLWGYGKKSYIAFNDSEVAAVETYYDSTIEKSNKYYAIYFGDEKKGLYEKALITHSLPNAYLYARQFDVNQAYLVTIENGKVTDSSDIYPYSESTDLQQIATDWLNEYYGLNTNETDLEKGIKVEEEHRDTVEKIAKGEITAEEGVKEIAKVHLGEDPKYYEKLEEVENPLGRFIEIVKSSKNFDDAYGKVKKIKDVPSFVADEFSAKYNPDGKLSMEKAFKVFYDEYKVSDSDNQKEIDKLLDKKSKLESKLFDAKSSSHEVMNRIGFGAGMRRSKVSFSTSKEDEIANKIKVIDERIKELKGLNSKEIPNDEINKIIRDLSTMDAGLKDYNDSVYKSGYDKLLASNKDSVLKEVKDYIQFQKDNAKYFTNEESKDNADKWLDSLVKLESKLIKDFYKIDSSISQKQELQELIDLLKDSIKENPKDQESKYLLELYEENLRELNAKFESGGSINRKLTYLGEVGGDKIGQKSSLEKAKSLEKKGISNEQIRQETGWFLNPYDKKWRFEISDEELDIVYNFDDAKKFFNENKNKTFFKIKLSDVIKHDKLFLAYPEFKNIPFYFYNKENVTLTGVFIPENKEKEIFIIYNLYDEKRRIENARGIRPTETNNETWLSHILRISDIISGGSRLDYRPISNDVYKFRRNILAHELQHIVQIREEFGAGSSSNWWYEEIIRKRGIDESKLSETERNNLRIESDLYYKNSSGEIEARDIDLRLNFNDKERKGIIPLSLVVVNLDYVSVDIEENRFKQGGELNAEEAIINAPCINEKFNFVESSDYNEYRKGGSINSMSKKELEAFYNTKEGKELDRQTYNKWKKLVNMNKSELEKFYNSEEGKEAGLSASEAKEKGIDSGRESARWIMKMKDIHYTEWTSDMWIWAKKQISFISRMSGMKGDLYDDKGNKTRKHTALLIWGHNPEKYENGGEIKKNMENELFETKGTLFDGGGQIKSNKVSVYQTNFSGLSFSDLGGYFDSNFTNVIDLEDENVILKSAPIFLFFKNPYDTRYSSKISIDDVIGAVIPKKMEQDARTIFDKHYISYITYNDDASNEDKIEAIKKLADINEDIILK